MNLCNKANIEFSKKRIDVRWGESSQVRAEMLLFEIAAQREHKYYHLISGVDLPLRTQNEIHSFFKNDNVEYIYMKQECSKWDYQRISRYHFPRTWGIHIISYINTIQEKLKIDRIKKYGFKCAKGFNWCSITHDAVLYLIKNKRFIRKITRFSSCADEVYKQYILFNSKFKDRIYKDGENRTNDLREIDWIRRNGDSPHIYTYEDYEILTNSHQIFARKLDESIDCKIIDLIVNYINERTYYENRSCNNLRADY